jgi:CRISPR-associated protein Cmr5
MAHNTIKRSADQKRAQFCLNRINEYENRDSAWQDNYVSYVKSLPATILMCGLGQAMASLLAKPGRDEGKPHGQLYRDIELWLCGNEGIFPGQDNLMTALTASDMGTYLHAQAESLSLLIWLKKFASAFLGKVGGKVE